jgi:hypothetical protein
VRDEKPGDVGGPLADDVELALEGVAGRRIGPARHRDLADPRLARLGGLAQTGVVGGHVAPAQHFLAFVDDDGFHQRHAGLRGGAILWQEHHADAVVADGRQGNAQRGELGAQESVGNLDQDAGAVAGQRIGAHGAAVLEVAQNLQALTHDVVRLHALAMDDEADTAAVMLVPGVVQTLARRHGHRATTPAR